jgi:hypothetical protein
MPALGRRKKGTGILKTARTLGLGTRTVQRIKNEMAGKVLNEFDGARGAYSPRACATSRVRLFSLKYRSR